MKRVTYYKAFCAAVEIYMNSSENLNFLETLQAALNMRKLFNEMLELKEKGYITETDFFEMLEVNWAAELSFIYVSVSNIYYVFFKHNLLISLKIFNIHICYY